MFWHLGLYWLSVLRGRSCPILCDPTDCIPLGSSVHGLFQARIPEWIAISYSRGSSQPRHWTHISYISCFGTPEPPARSLTRDGTQVTDPQPISKIVNNSSARRPFIYKPIQSAPPAPIRLFTLQPGCYPHPQPLPWYQTTRDNLVPHTPLELFSLSNPNPAYLALPIPSLKKPQ